MMGFISGLPEDFRDVLVAVDVAGLSYKEAVRRARRARGHRDEPALPRPQARRHGAFA